MTDQQELHSLRESAKALALRMRWPGHPGHLGPCSLAADLLVMIRQLEETGRCEVLVRGNVPNAEELAAVAAGETDGFNEVGKIGPLLFAAKREDRTEGWPT